MRVSFDGLCMYPAVVIYSGLEISNINDKTVESYVHFLVFLYDIFQEFEQIMFRIVSLFKTCYNINGF